MPYELIVQSDFSAAHRLREYRGKCDQLHGHNWRVELRLVGGTLDAQGMLIDFGDARRVLAETLEQFDHGYLNDVPPFDKINPSCENIARVIAEDVAKRLPDGVCVGSVIAWESARCGITYTPPAGGEEA